MYIDLENDRHALRRRQAIQDMKYAQIRNVGRLKSLGLSVSQIATDLEIPEDRVRDILR